MSTPAPAPHRPVNGRRKDGLVGLWGRLMNRKPEAYEAWLEEHDMTAITACLLRLNERQLNRLGFSRTTLALDVEDLALRARREAALSRDVLRLVSDADKAERAAVAAE